MAREKTFRSQLYRAARDLGNVEAVKNDGVEAFVIPDYTREARRRLARARVGPFRARRAN
ncbi:MAG: hypothetical protein WB765_21150 [Acidimicrobiales bacterium]|jgi:hypothetical protein